VTTQVEERQSTLTTTEEELARIARRRELMSRWFWRIMGYVVILGLWEFASGRVLEEALLPGPIRVFEDPVLSMEVGGYQVVLAAAPEEKVLVTATPVPLRESEQEAGGRGLELNGSEDGVTLTFTRENWFRPQTIVVTAIDDDLAERGRPTIVDVVVTRQPGQMLPGVDARTVQVKKGDRVA